MWITILLSKLVEKNMEIYVKGPIENLYMIDTGISCLILSSTTKYKSQFYFVRIRIQLKFLIL